MSIDDGLRERIAEMSSDVQGGPSLQRAIQAGRARRRRRAVAAVGSGVATVCAVGVVAGAAMTGLGPFDGEDGRAPVAANWKLAAPPEDVPALIEQSVREQLPAGTKVTDKHIGAYAEGDYPYAEPEPKVLPPQKWDEAASWLTAFRLDNGQTIRVAVLPQDPETAEIADDLEANLRKYCREAILAGDLSCEYDEVSEGMYVTDKETTLRRATDNWAKAGGWSGVDADGVKNPNQVWFERTAEAAPGGAYSVRVGDEVNVTSYEQAKAHWMLDADALQRIATDHDLLEQRSDG